MKPLTLWLLSALLPLFGASDTITSYLPHFTQKAGEWQTILTLNNPNSTPIRSTLRAWNESGTLLAEMQLTIPRAHGYSRPIDDFFPQLGENVGWLSIESSPNLQGIMTFYSVPALGETSLPLMRQIGTNLFLPLLENTESRLSGFVITNISDETVQLNLTLSSLDGSFREEANIDLGAKAKAKGVLADFFDGPIPEQAQLEVQASQPITGLALTFQNGAEQIIAVPGSFWDPGLLPELQKSIDEDFIPGSVGGGIAGLSMPGRDPIVAATGLANVETGEALTPDSRIDTGSITKMFTATLALLLQEDGKLDLDDTLDHFVPQYPSADLITVRMLLNHTSGIPDFGNNEAFIFDFFETLGADRHFAPEEMVAAAAALPPLFPPGTDYSYSNTNYILAGMIIEMVGQDSYGNQLHQRILDPLGMKQTHLAGFEPVPNQARRYLTFPELEFMGDVTDLENQSLFWAAGALVSTGADLITWAEALFGGKVLTQASLTEMLEAGPTFYGLGVGHIQIGGEQAYFHDGGTFGGSALLLYFPDRQITMVEQFNHRAFDVAVPDFIRGMLAIAGIQTSSAMKLWDSSHGFNPKSSN